MHYREATEEDIDAIVKLYKAVVESRSDIVRNEEEITEAYVRNFITKSMESGLIIVAENPENPAELIAEIHGYKEGIRVFDHVLSHVTIVVHPHHQGKKIGRTIGTIFLQEIATNKADIGKVELITRESNRRAIALYESLGFKIEGRLEMRIKTFDNRYEADIPMGWQNPNYDF